MPRTKAGGSSSPSIASGHPGDAERFEQFVSYAASLVYHLVNDGVEVGFRFG